MGKAVMAAIGAVAAAVGSALCCAGPLAAIALGMSGAGLAATFEPLRPYFAGG
ncbi:MAG TPA: mercuric transporter MerT family protein [Gemmatimonadales bacterium]|nr:mercuric transporter MerT family protein [Gemmatimonadales bacterium]